jgi:hypothetical protein
VRSALLLVAAALFVTVSAPACSSSSSSGGHALGEGCTQNPDCASGLSCLPALVGGQCTSQMTCTKTCSADADCTAASAKAKCFAGCGNDKICLLTP